MADLGTVGRNISPPMVQGTQKLSIRPLPDLSATITGTVTDDSGNPAERTVRCYARTGPYGGMLLDETVSAAGDGSYTVKAIPGAEHDIVALDDDSGTVFNDKIAGRIVPD